MTAKSTQLKLARSGEGLPTQEEAVVWMSSVLQESGLEFSGSDGGDHPPDWTVWTEWFKVADSKDPYFVENGARVDIFARNYLDDYPGHYAGVAFSRDAEEPPPGAKASPYVLLTVPAHEYVAQAEPTHPYHDPPSGRMPTGKERKLAPNWKPKGSAELETAARMGEYLSMDDMMTWVWDVLRMSGYHPFRYDPEAEYNEWANYRAWFTDGEHTIRVDLFGDYDQEFHERRGEAPCPWAALSFYDYLGPPRIVPNY